MSKKQEIYAQIVRLAVYDIRSYLATLKWRWWRMMPWSCLSLVSAAYALTEFIHTIPANVVDPEFTPADLRFLNEHAKLFYSLKNADLKSTQSGLSPMVHSLISLVPSGDRHSVTWVGPDISLVPEQFRQEIFGTKLE